MVLQPISGCIRRVWWRGVCGWCLRAAHVGARQLMSHGPHLLTSRSLLDAPVALGQASLSGKQAAKQQQPQPRPVTPCTPQLPVWCAARCLLHCQAACGGRGPQGGPAAQSLTAALWPQVGVPGSPGMTAGGRGAGCIAMCRLRCRGQPAEGRTTPICARMFAATRQHALHASACASVQMACDAETVGQPGEHAAQSCEGRPKMKHWLQQLHAHAQF